MSREIGHLEPALPGVHPLREVWSIAWPTVLTMTSYTVMQFIDKLMVGRVGPLEVAAQGNGGIWSFTPIAIAFGILTVVNTYVSQNLGAGTPERGPRYAWAAIWLSAAMWALVMIPGALLMPKVFQLVHHGQLQRFTELAQSSSAAISADAQMELGRLAQMIPLETRYAQILLIGSLVLMTGKGLHHYFFGLHRPKVVTFSAIVGNGVNVLANYVLIFGDEGMPELGLPGVPGVRPLGLYGAAIGTVIGTCFELAIPAAIFLGPTMNRRLASRGAWRPALGPIRELLKIGWPAAVQFGNEIICWSIFMSTLVGTFGTDHQTAGWIALGYMHLSFMPAVGFSVAVTSLVGKYIGAGRPDVAVARARLGLSLAVGYMTACAVVFFLFRAGLVEAFISAREISADRAVGIIEIGAKLMICAAIFQTIDAFGIVYTGALRGAGDTVWPGVITVVYSWAFIVAGGWAMTMLWPELESIGPWIGASVYIIIFGITMAWRFESGRWRSIRLLSGAEREAARVAPLGPGPPATEPDASVRDIAGEIVGESADGSIEPADDADGSPSELGMP